MRPYALTAFVLLAGVLGTLLAVAMRHWKRERRQPPLAFPLAHPGTDRPADRVRRAGPESEGDVHELEVPSQDRPQGYKRLFYIMGKPGMAAVRLHVWCEWENRAELLGFQIVTGIDSGIAVNWQGGSSKDQFSIMEWSEDSYVFHPVSFSDNAGSVEELRRCTDVIRASRLDRTIVEPIASVLEKRAKEMEAR